MKLHILKGDHNSAKILALIKKLGLNVEIRYLNPKTYIKDPKFIKISPEQKTPVLQTAFDSFDSVNTILRYISRKNKEKGFSGVIPREEAKIDEWLEYCAFKIDPLVKKLAYAKKNILGIDKDSLLEQLKSEISKLSLSLTNKNSLVGYSLSLADLSIGVSFFYPLKDIFEENFKETFTEFYEYLQRVSEEFRLEQLPKFFKSVEFLDIDQQFLEENENELKKKKKDLPQLNKEEISRKTQGINLPDQNQNADFQKYMTETCNILVNQVMEMNGRLKSLESKGVVAANEKISPQVKNIPENYSDNTKFNPIKFDLEKSPKLKKNILKQTEPSSKIILSTHHSPLKHNSSEKIIRTNIHHNNISFDCVTLSYNKKPNLRQSGYLGRKPVIKYFSSNPTDYNTFSNVVQTRTDSQTRPQLNNDNSRIYSSVQRNYLSQSSKFFVLNLCRV